MDVDIDPAPNTRPARPPRARFGLIVGWAAALAAGIGAVAGLVIGLVGYPPTAWFAAIEVAVPAGIAGAVVGCLVGAAVVTLSRVRRPR